MPRNAYEDDSVLSQGQFHLNINLRNRNSNTIPLRLQLMEMIFYMKSTEMHVVIDMNAHREAIKMSKQALADKVHKDVSVVAKQITETKRTNMMLFNAYEFADALGGAIIFATDEQLEEYKHIDEYKKAAQEAESLRAENDKLKSENEKVADREKKLLEKLDKMQDKLDHKDASIERKDALLLTLLKQKELMTKALHKAGVDLSFLELS